MRRTRNRRGRVVLIAMFFAALITSPSAFAAGHEGGKSAIECDNTLENYKEVQGRVITSKRERYFEIRDLDHDFSIVGTVDVHGTLRVQLQTVDHSTQTRSVWRGRDLYKQMMDHLGADKISLIEDMWIEGEDQNNWVDYEKNLKTGMTPKQAAAKTWTGAMVAKYGFKVKSVEPTSLFGMPALFVQFEKAM